MTCPEVVAELVDHYLVEPIAVTPCSIHDDVVTDSSAHASIVEIAPADHARAFREHPLAAGRLAPAFDRRLHEWRQLGVIGPHLV